MRDFEPMTRMLSILVGRKKSTHRAFLSSLLLALLNMTVASFLVSGQDGKRPLGSEELRPPDQEKFTPTSGEELIIPWRESDRDCFNPDVIKTCGNRRIITNEEYLASDVMTIYDSDGKQWYQFKIGLASPDYSLDRPKKGFDPLAIFGSERYPWVVALRIAAESENWCEVEVNEQTRETKFILKSDQMWAKVTWNFIFNWSQFVYADPKITGLYDNPDGKLIEDAANSQFEKLKYERLEGDWMRVNWWGHYSGWIRWRNGRKILVGSILNRNRVPVAAASYQKL